MNYMMTPQVIADVQLQALCQRNAASQPLVCRPSRISGIILRPSNGGAGGATGDSPEQTRAITALAKIQTVNNRWRHPQRRGQSPPGTIPLRGPT